MTTPELDLDAVADDLTPGGDRAIGARAVALAVGLAGLAIGLLTGSALDSSGPAYYPLVVTLSTRDVYLDSTLPANAASSPTAGASTAPAGALPSDPAAGRPVVVLRLQVDNLGPARLRLASLILTGVATKPVELPLSSEIPTRTAITVDVAVRPDCRDTASPALPEARLTFDSGPTDGTTVQTTGVMRTAGGLCSLVDVDLPTGWQRPMFAIATAQHADDLDVTLSDFSQEQVTGTVVEGRFLPTMFVGDQLLEASAQVQPGRPTVLRLQAPPPCVQTDRGAPAPSTVRILARGPEGIEQRLVVVGPDLTRWLRTSCDGIRTPQS
jgi:hypothetical protein